MKFAVLLSVALLGCCDATSQASLSFAQAWLRSHAAPNQDEMAEIKDANPEAYAIVQALLTKRSLGLLNNKNPTASFVPKATDMANSAPVPSGTAVFALSAEDKAAVVKSPDVPVASEAPVAADADVVQAPVAPHHHGDFMNWKPNDNDDAMVNSVMGQVANLAGQKKLESGSILGADEDMVDVEAPKVAPVAEAAPAAPQENSYLRGSGLSPVAAATPAAATTLATDAPAGGSALASFSWGDDQPQQKAQQPAAVATQAQPKKRQALNTLSSWLDGPSKVPAEQAAETPKANPYSVQW